MTGAALPVLGAGTGILRSVGRRSRMAAMPNSMFHLDERMADIVLAYCRDRLALDPVPLDFGGVDASLDEALTGLLTETGRDPAHVMEVFAQSLAPAVVSIDSPRFLAFIPAAPTKASLLFDMVVSCSSLQATSWLEAAGAVAAENQTLRLLADLAGMPASAGGCFVSGGTGANLSALVVARDTAHLRRPGNQAGRVRIAVSEEAHASVGRALSIIGVDALLVPDNDHRLTGPALAAALERDPDPDSVIGVVATAGTTNAGIIDDLAGIASVASARSLWFHIDGAYGGAGIFSEKLRPRYAGIEHADSLVIDPHKWLFAPFDCAGLLYREPALARAVHTQDASYLEVIHDAEHQEWNPSDYAIHLTRRARGMPLWFSLAVNGTDAYAEAVEAGVSMAGACAELVRRTPHLELVREPELSVVLFRRPGWGRPDYDAWSSSLLTGQTAFVTPTTWEGESVARLAFLHPDTTLDMVEEIFATMAESLTPCPPMASLRAKRPSNEHDRRGPPCAVDLGRPQGGKPGGSSGQASTERREVRSTSSAAVARKTAAERPKGSAMSSSAARPTRSRRWRRSCRTSSHRPWSPPSSDTTASPRCTMSRRVKDRARAPGSLTTTSRTCWRVMPRINPAPAMSAGSSWRLRCRTRSTPWAAAARTASGGTGSPPGNRPRDSMGTDRPRARVWSSKNAAAIGDRQRLAVHTKRNVMTRAYREALIGGLEQLGPKRGTTCSVRTPSTYRWNPWVSIRWSIRSDTSRLNFPVSPSFFITHGDRSR